MGRRAVCVGSAVPDEPSRMDDPPNNETEPENGGESDSVDLIAFNVAVDGSGGEICWGVGLLDQLTRLERHFGGLCIFLGALRAMNEGHTFCDAHVCEALAMYFALSYARHVYGGRCGCGIVICDRTQLLTNIAGLSLQNPVFQMAADFVHDQMVKALQVFSSIRFVHKRCHGHTDSWTPDRLAKLGRQCAQTLNGHVHVPCPLLLDPIRFTDLERDNNGMIERVTIERG